MNYYNKGIAFVGNIKLTLILCIFLSLYIARISKGYTLPISLYNILNNPLIRGMAIILIILLSKINLPLTIMVILSYALFSLSYESQNINSKNEKYMNYI